MLQDNRDNFINRVKMQYKFAFEIEFLNLIFEVFLYCYTKKKRI